MGLEINEKRTKFMIVLGQSYSEICKTWYIKFLNSERLYISW